MALFVLITGACGFGATPEAHEAPSVTVQPTSAPIPESTTVVPLSPAASTMMPSPTPPRSSPETPTAEVAAESYVALYKILLAGDYYALHISASGWAEYTRHSRGYEILSHRKGDLGPEGAAGLLAQLQDQGFYEMEEIYQPVPPAEGTPAVKYEDVYYWLRASDGHRTKTVLAHEYGSPPQLQQVIRILLAAGSALPEGNGEGPFLLGLGYETLPYLRREEGMASLLLDEENLQAYPTLERAARHPCSLVSSEKQPSSDPEQLFPSGTHMMEVMLNDEHFVILLLRR